MTAVGAIFSFILAIRHLMLSSKTDRKVTTDMIGWTIFADSESVKKAYVSQHIAANVPARRMTDFFLEKNEVKAMSEPAIGRTE